MKKPSDASIAIQVGCTRESVAKWLHEAGLTPESEGAVELCKQRHKKKDEPDPNQIDPSSGLTWYKLEQKEKALKLVADRVKKERLESREYIQTSEVLKIFSVLCSKLEQVPGKAKSELSLSEEQKVRIQKMFDDARQDAAKEISES